MRSALFNLIFKPYALTAAALFLPLAFLPWRTPLAWMLRQWARSVVFLMRAVAGIRVEVRGRANIPQDGPAVIAAKHQSECDGIVVLSLVPGLAVVAMQELGRIPLVGRVLRRLEMILVDTDGGPRQQKTLTAGARRAAAKGRSILIYPEATLMRVGAKERYRTGVYHVARDLGVPVAPVATNMGLCWDRRQRRKRPGHVVVEFLPPMAAGDDKAAFMAGLEAVIETRSNQLAGEGLAGRPRLSPSPACGGGSGWGTERSEAS